MEIMFDLRYSTWLVSTNIELFQQKGLIPGEKSSFVDPFVPNAPFHVPLETIRKPYGFLRFSRDRERIGNEWVKSKVKLIQSNIYHQGITKNREKFFQSLWEKSFLLKYFFSTMEVNFIAGCAVINSWVLYLISKIYAILIFFMKC